MMKKKEIRKRIDKAQQMFDALHEEECQIMEASADLSRELAIRRFVRLVCRFGATLFICDMFQLAWDYRPYHDGSKIGFEVTLALADKEHNSLGDITDLSVDGSRICIHTAYGYDIAYDYDEDPEVID